MRVFVPGASTPYENGYGTNVVGLSNCRLTRFASRSWRRVKSRKNYAFLLIGPLNVAIRFLVSEAGRPLVCKSNGLRAFQMWSL